MKRDKTGMSTTVLHMLKMQIKAEANQLREIRQPQFKAKSPSQKRHFFKHNQETLPRESLTPNASKRHFLNLSFSESPLNIHKQRKHFVKQYKDQLFMGDIDKHERCHPMIRTTKAQSRIQIDVSGQKSCKKENRKSLLDRFFRKKPTVSKV